jgi:hypothetical protein
VEIKYPHWTYRARLTGVREDMRKFVDKFMRFTPRKLKPGAPIDKSKKGLGQIKNFVLKYHAGEVETRVNMDNKIITPILILGEPFPPDPMNRVWLEGLAGTAGCVIPNTKPFILLTSEEVELLESIAEDKGADVAVKLLSDYSRMFKQRAVKYDIPSSFRNMLIQSKLQVRNNKFLKRQLDDFSDEVIKHLKKNP